MLTEQMRERGDFTSAENAIIDAIMEKKSAIGSIPATDLAKAASVSKAAITRLCRKLDCATYREFQKRLEEEFVVLQRLSARINAEPITQNMTYEEIRHFLSAYYESAVFNTATAMDRQTIQQVVGRLNRAKKLDIYGSGISHAIAELAAFKFSTLGMECGVYNGLNEHFIMADEHPEQKAILLFSITGENPTIMKTAEWLKKRRYYILGIGGEGLLKGECTHYLTVPVEENVFGLEAMNAFNMVNYIVDFIFVSLLVKGYDRHRAVAMDILKSKQGVTG